MTRSHPPSLITQVARLVRDEALFARGDLVLAACSGGPDSSALMHALALLRRRLGHALVAVGVDHGLRSEARAELGCAAELARSLDVGFDAVEVAVGAGSNLQARARQARHEALQARARAHGAKVIALGHTADDRAETFLLRLLRGAGPRGLAVLPARAPGVAGDTPLVRPLLSCRRLDVEAHVRRHGLDVARDPSNRDRRYLRVRVREELVPLLEELSPGIVSHLCALAAMLPSDEEPLGALGREQRRAIERAIQQGMQGRRIPATVALSGRQEVQIRVQPSVEKGKKGRRNEADEG